MTGTELRYGFGSNWNEYVERHFNEDRLSESTEHMLNFLKMPSLGGQSFLDIGCGSGLHSLAAFKAGAVRVHSFDYDANSVRTTIRLREMAGNPKHWTIEQGSVLDEAFIRGLPTADVVYSWGVLHHTGRMWQAIRNAALPLKPTGVMYIALYTSDVYTKRTPEYWLDVKKRYNHAGTIGKRVMEWNYALRTTILPELRGGRNPLRSLYGGGTTRGMNYWTDVKDWLGGWPMEFAGIAETKAFCSNLELELLNIKAGEANTEYLFRRHGATNYWNSVSSGFEFVQLKAPFSHRGGKAYVTPMDIYRSTADNDGHPRRSRLMLYENGVPVGFPHQRLSDIQRFGGGRYSHRDNEIVFSATDGSDPNSNGRQYTICADSLS